LIKVDTTTKREYLLRLFVCLKVFNLEINVKITGEKILIQKGQMLLLRDFKSAFRWECIISSAYIALGLIIIVLLIISMTKDTNSVLIVMLVIVGIYEGVVISLACFKISPYVKDLEFVNKKQCIEARGTIIRIEKKLTGINFKRLIYENFYIFYDERIQREVTLKCSNYLEVGRRYAIYYFPNTGIAVKSERSVVGYWR